MATVVSLHAHPDDESLYTGGTIARLAAQGHRVVVVTATNGERGLLARDEEEPGRVRAAELDRAAALLGAARVVRLGYADSGSATLGRDQSPALGSFCRQPVEKVASRVATLLVEERAELLTSYDAAGGYGHPDHLMVHRVGAAAARLAGTPRLLEATVDRDLLVRALRVAGRLRRLPPDFAAARFASAYTPHVAITHRVDVRAFVERKRAALAAHVSQAGGGDTARTAAVLLGLPGPFARFVLGREWFVQPGMAPPRRPYDDPLTGLSR